MKEQKIIELLPVGKENAISSEMLCDLTGISDKRTLQKVIAKERESGALILSHYSGGYYTSNNRLEVAEFARTLENRAKHTLLSLRAAKRFLNKTEGQVTLDLKESE